MVVAAAPARGLSAENRKRLILTLASIALVAFPIMPNGTGDAVAALFTAHWLDGGNVAHALEKAAASIFAVLEATQAMGERELQLVAAQDKLVSPQRRFTAEKL